MVQTETVEFNGRTYVRYPLSPHRSARVYFTVYENSRRVKGAGQLHVEVWKAANGNSEVPPGHVIHHADLDPLNNDPGNLVCITRKEHARLHEAGRDLDSPEWLAHLARIRPLAAEWHRSEEGRAWHSRHARGTWVGRERVTRVCEECGRKFEAVFADRVRCCSSACIQRLYRKERRYQVQVPCPVCATLFWQSKYGPHPTACSASCAQRIRRAKERA